MYDDAACLAGDDPEGNNLRGVQVFEHASQEYVAASGRDAGLWIFRCTGD